MPVLELHPEGGVAEALDDGALDLDALLLSSSYADAPVPGCCSRAARRCPRTAPSPRCWTRRSRPRPPRTRSGAAHPAPRPASPGRCRGGAQPRGPRPARSARAGSSSPPGPAPRTDRRPRPPRTSMGPIGAPTGRAAPRPASTASRRGPRPRRGSPRSTSRSGALRAAPRATIVTSDGDGAVSSPVTRGSVATRYSHSRRRTVRPARSQRAVRSWSASSTIVYSGFGRSASIAVGEPVEDGAVPGVDAEEDPTVGSAAMPRHGRPPGRPPWPATAGRRPG